MPSEVCSSTRSTNWCRVVCARSIVIPPSPVITAVPVKGIIDPTSVRTIGRSPKRVSPYSTDYAADDRPWRPGDKEARSRTKRRTNGVSSRVGGRGCHKSDECGCHEHCLARECPDRKTPRFGDGRKQVRHHVPNLVLARPTRRKFKRTIVAIHRRSPRTRRAIARLIAESAS